MQEGKRSWPSKWERIETMYEDMAQASIPVHTTVNGEQVEVARYVIPVPDGPEDQESFLEWAENRLGADSALEAIFSGVQVKIAQQLRGGANIDPEKQTKKARDAFARLRPEDRLAILAELQGEEYNVIA